MKGMWRWRVSGLCAALGAFGVLVGAAAPVSGADVRGAGLSRGAVPRCAGAAVAAIPAPQSSGVEVGIDVSLSASAAALRAEYAVAARAAVEQAASDHAAVRVVGFGASGVGARVILAGSFAASLGDELYDLAAANRLRCWARIAIAEALVGPRSRRGGTDVAGTLAGLIAHGRGLVRPGGGLTVTMLTDGCQAPSRAGPNRALTDVCGKLARGVAAARILRAHPGEFVLPDARGVTVVVRGVGVGGSVDSANSSRARRLVEFWTVVCRRAQARRCDVSSSIV